MFRNCLFSLGCYFGQLFILVYFNLLMFVFAAAIIGGWIFFHATTATGWFIGMRKIGLYQFSHAIMKMYGKPGGNRHIQQQEEKNGKAFHSGIKVGITGNQDL